MDLVGPLTTVINVPLGEKDAITVVLKTTSQRFVANLKIPIRTQNLSRGVNNVEKDHQNEDVNQISANFDPDLESNHSSDEDNCVAVVSSTDSTTSVDAINLPVIFGNTSANVLVDSGSICTIINESLANSVISRDSKSKWIREANPKQLKTFSNEPIHTVGILQTSILRESNRNSSSGGWKSFSIG